MREKKITYHTRRKRDFDGLLHLIVEWQLFEIKQNEKAKPNHKQIIKTQKQYLLEHYLDNTTTHIIAKKNDIAIGYVFVGYDKDYVGEGNIYELFIIETERQKGIASELYKKGIEWLILKKCSKVILGVHSSNKTALNFYKKLKFKPLKEDYITLSRKIN